MELWMSDQITLDATSLALMNDVEETARKVRDYRPLPPEIVRRIEDDLLPERVYSSNAIEGNTLDLRETEAILKAGAIITKKKREAREALNLGDAVKLITQWQRAKTPSHTVDKFLAVHGILLRELNDDWAGQYRKEGVMITGAKYQPPDHTLVPSLTQKVFEHLSAPTDSLPLLRAAWAHWAIARIHPFMDGNGRMARLWQDLLLFQSDFTCAIVRNEDRRQYRDALTRADEGDFNLFFQLIAQRLLATFDRYLSQIGVMMDEEKWLEDVVGHVESKAEQEKLEYIQWSRMMERLKWEFELAAARITKASNDIKVQIRTVSRMDQVEWDNIKGKRSEHKDFFVVDFYYLGRHSQYPFRCMIHPWTENDTKEDRTEIRVGLCPYFTYFFLERSWTEPIREDWRGHCPLTLCEVFVLEQTYVYVHRIFPRDQDRSGNRPKIHYQRDVPPHKIARDFLAEVVKYEMQKL